MQGMNDFIREHGFTEKDGQYFGMYNDMHMVIKEEDEISAYLYLDLPPEGRKARRDLENQLNETGERYDAKVAADSAHKGFLKITVKNNMDAGSNLDRFLTNCDLLLRPYGREMGLLCAYCRREMQDVKPEYKMENGLVVPVCPECVNLESASKAKKGDNRRTIDQKRMTKGLIGAGIGCVLSIVVWFFAGIGGGFIINILAALISVFLIKWLFERFSKVPNRLNSVTICVFAILALLIGRAVGFTANINTFNESMRENAEYLITYGTEETDASQETVIKAYQNGEYDNVTVIHTLTNPVFYSNIIVPVAAVLIASFGADSINLKPRRRR